MYWQRHVYTRNSLKQTVDGRSKVYWVCEAGDACTGRAVSTRESEDGEDTDIRVTKPHTAVVFDYEETEAENLETPCQVTEIVYINRQAKAQFLAHFANGVVDAYRTMAISLQNPELTSPKYVAARGFAHFRTHDSLTSQSSRARIAVVGRSPISVHDINIPPDSPLRNLPSSNELFLRHVGDLRDSKCLIFHTDAFF